MNRFARLAPLFLLVAACDPTAGSDDGSTTPPPETCELPLTGFADASPEVTTYAGIARYRYTVELGPDDLTLDLEDDAGGNLGRLRMRTDRAFTHTFEGQAPEEKIGRVFLGFEDAEGRADIAVTHYVADFPAPQRLLQIEHEGRELFVRVTLDGDDPLARPRTVMVRQADVASAPSTGFELYAELPVLTSAARETTAMYAYEASGDDAAEAWLTEVGFDAWNDSGTLRRLIGALMDRAWVDVMADHIERCIDEDGVQSASLVGRTARGLNGYACLEGFAVAGGIVGAVTGAVLAAPAVPASLTLVGTALAATPYATAKAFECLCTNVDKRIVGCGLGCEPTACQQACHLSLNQCTERKNITARCEDVEERTLSYIRQGCVCEVTVTESECDTPSIRQDPHIETFDGLRYDLQGAGEFVAVEAFEGAPFVVQVRMEPYRERACGGVSTNTAMATQVGDHRVSLYVVQGDLRVVIDDEEVMLAAGENRKVGDGRVDRTADDEVTIAWPDGSQATMRGIDVFFELDPALTARVRGLIGTANEDETDEIVLRDGTTIPYPVSFEDIHDRLADSWRISGSESLFTYADGDDTSTFTDRSFPPTYHDVTTLDPEDVADATAACAAAGVTDRVLMEDCILDVVCTGADANVYANLVGGPRVPVSRPAGLEAWIPIGDGEWFQSESRVRLVDTATAPELLVSAAAYDAFALTARFNVTSASSGYAGFLLGLTSPTAEGEPIDAYLLSWKGPGDDDWDGATAREGFTFARVDGAFDATAVRDQLWAQVESPAYQVLDRSNGAGLGFDGNYEVQLVYAPDRMEITVRDDDDDSVVYDVAVAPTAGTFPAGRVGLYALRQAWVGMSQVELVRF